MRSNGIFWCFGTEVAAITWGNSVIYDDDLKSQELVRQIFEPTGCDVITAVCGLSRWNFFSNTAGGWARG
jgi:hypothetical protein